MVVDETFMWLYLFYKVGGACGPVALVLGTTSGLLLIFGIGLSTEDGTERTLGKSLLRGLWVSIPLAFICMCAACVAPRMDELKAYAAFRIGEKAVTSNAAKRMMDAALLYLEGKAQGK
jgi:hypothetical protein